MPTSKRSQLRDCSGETTEEYRGQLLVGNKSEVPQITKGECAMPVGFDVGHGQYLYLCLTKHEHIGNVLLKPPASGIQKEMKCFGFRKGLAEVKRGDGTETSARSNPLAKREGFIFSRKPALGWYGLVLCSGLVCGSHSQVYRENVKASLHMLLHEI